MQRYIPKEGYIQVWRRLRNHRFWPTYKRRRFTELEAWLDLLFDATYKAHRHEFRGQVFDLKPGELVFSQEEKAEHWRWSRGTVRRFLENLYVNGEAVHKKTKGVTRLTVCKLAGYAEWRPDDGTDSGTGRRRTGKKEKKGGGRREGKDLELQDLKPLSSNKVQVLVRSVLDNIGKGKKKGGHR